jgi:glycerol-3-phosphate acyltransferase PlsX
LEIPPKITLAIDAMGGDHAPHAIITGTELAVRLDPSITPILVGDEQKIRPLIKADSPLRDVRIHHTTDKVASDDVPSQALRSGKKSSMRLAIDLVNDGTADAVVSAGNSGALLIMALMALRTIEGIDRPAMAAFFPTMNGRCCMLDLGANIECSATNLVQFAVMGDAFFRVTADESTNHAYKPSIGLLNVGEEEQKGSASIRDAAAILADPEINMNYYGFVEGSDFPMGGVDIVVSDGFSGNVALKTAEGTSRLIGTMIRQAFQSTFFSRIGYLLASRSFKKLRDMMNPQNYNGAVLLGLNGIVVKSHGSADPKGFANAIKVASDMHRNNFMEDVKVGIARSLKAIEMSQNNKASAE